MKKITASLLILFFGISLFAQKATVLLSEDFSTAVPPAGWTIDGMASQWSSSATAKAGGTAPEARLAYVSGTDTTHFISPVIDLTGYSAVVFSFKHFLDDFSGSGYTIGVATRSGGSSLWNDVWSTNPAGDIGPETKDLVISNADVGASDFEISIYLAGNTYNFDYWYIDDIMLFAPDNNDAALESINLSSYLAPGNVDIKCTFKNFGLTNITSLDLNYQTDNGSVITENVSGLNLTTTQTLDHTFATPWNATFGDYNLKVWLSNINGTGNDDNQNNDTLNLIMHIATQEVSRMPLYEEFTSSTCSPCANFNSNYFTTSFLDNNAGKFSIIKYQMNWPTPGDPYYTDERGTRRAFYDVSGVPTLLLDATEGTYFNTSELQTALDNASLIPAFFSISANTQIFGNMIYIDGEIIPYINASNFTVHTVVVEKTTTENTGNNGETEFHYVMMKMLPDANGTAFNFTAGTPVTISESFDMGSTNVEEMGDLAVVIFIQDNETKDIFQSVWATQDLAAIFTPADGEQNVFIDYPVIINFSDSIRKIDNSEITDTDIASFCHLSDTNVDIPFTATIDTTKTKITINPDNNFNPNTVITVSIDANTIENSNGVSFIGGSINFTTGTETNTKDIKLNDIKVFPNPASDFLKVSGVTGGQFTITDISGKQLMYGNIDSKKDIINVKNIPSGVYFITVISNNTSVTKKFIKK